LINNLIIFYANKYLLYPPFPKAYKEILRIIKLLQHLTFIRSHRFKTHIVGFKAKKEFKTIFLDSLSTLAIINHSLS